MVTPRHFGLEIGSCVKTIFFSLQSFKDLTPDKWWAPPKSNPSPLHGLKVQLASLNGDPASHALNITWSINIDSEYYDFEYLF